MNGATVTVAPNSLPSDQDGDVVQETTPTKKTEFYAPTDGQFSAIVVRVKTSGMAPMVKVVGDGPLAGRDGTGIFISGKHGSTIIGPAILKLQTSDRIDFTLRGGYIVNLHRTHKAPNAANKTSGRNEPPVPQPQPSMGGKAGRIAQLRKRPSPNLTGIDSRKCTACHKTFVSARALMNGQCAVCRSK